MAKEVDLNEEPDYDFEGAYKLAERLYGGTDENYDPDILINAIVLTLVDSGRGRLASAEYDKRVKYYWNVLNQKPDLYDQFMQLFKVMDDADMQARINVSNMISVARMSVLSGLRHTTVLLRETGIFKGNFLRAYVDGKNYKAYIYTTPKHVSPQYKGDCSRYSYSSLLFACGMRRISTVVLNPDTYNLSFTFEEINDAGSRLFSLEKKLQEVIQAGMSGEDLFPALMEQYYGRYAECAMKDGTVFGGWVEAYEVPDVWWPKGFVLRTEKGPKVIYTDNLGTIKHIPAPKGSKSYKKA
ncbi:MAG: hypothetical protein LUE27_08295 [Clostridia bacterium]|nr:hypothetical protein [Clostridia bacterium]